MALYKTSAYLTSSSDTVFDNSHNPSATTPLSGIYRCIGCRREIISTKGHPLPTQNHHQHDQAQGSIRWRLIVLADHRPK